MSVLENHLQYLENMVLILNSINSIPNHVSPPSRSSQTPPIPSSQSPTIPQVSLVSPRLPASSPPLVRTQPYGLLGQMISQSVRSYLIHEVESVLNELSVRDIGVQLLSRVFNVPDEDDWDSLEEAIVNLEVIMRDDVQNESSVNQREYHPDHLSHAGEFIQKSPEQDNDCSICFESLKDEDMFKTHCGHTYHPRCLHSWLNRKQNCPVCRSTF